MNYGYSETRARTQAMVSSKTSLSRRPVDSFAFAKVFLDYLYAKPDRIARASEARARV